MVSLDEVWSKFEALARPLEPIEVSLAEAVGLVLAEPVVADVDLPAFDCAAAEGYAVRAGDAGRGALLRVVAPPTDLEADYEIDAGESAFVSPGGALPIGADSVLDPGGVRSDAGSSGPRVVEVAEPAAAGAAVTPRGALLKAGATILGAGTRLAAPMIALLAAQGQVHPMCHRRVRVSLLAVGDHLVQPSEAPTLHRERNAANLAATALLSAAGAMVQDLGVVSEADAAQALERATNAHVAIVMGRFGGGLLRRLAKEGVKPAASGIDLDPLDSAQYGVIHDDGDFAVAHLLCLPLDPFAVVVGTALLALPLVARLQGGASAVPPVLHAERGEGDFPAVQRPSALPARLRLDDRGRLTVEPVPLRAPGDLPALARANALAILDPADAASDRIKVVPISGFGTE